MTNVEEIKSIMAETSKTFGSIDKDSRLYEAKLWYLTGVLNGVLRASGKYLNADELREVLAYKDTLLKE